MLIEPEQIANAQKDWQDFYEFWLAPDVDLPWHFNKDRLDELEYFDIEEIAEYVEAQVFCFRYGFSSWRVLPNDWKQKALDQGVYDKYQTPFIRVEDLPDHIYQAMLEHYEESSVYLNFKARQDEYRTMIFYDFQGSDMDQALRIVSDRWEYSANEEYDQRLARALQEKTLAALQRGKGYLIYHALYRVMWKEYDEINKPWVNILEAASNRYRNHPDSNPHIVGEMSKMIRYELSLDMRRICRLKLQDQLSSEYNRDRQVQGYYDDMVAGNHDWAKKQADFFNREFALINPDGFGDLRALIQEVGAKPSTTNFKRILTIMDQFKVDDEYEQVYVPYVKSSLKKWGSDVRTLDNMRFSNETVEHLVDSMVIKSNTAWKAFTEEVPRAKTRQGKLPDVKYLDLRDVLDRKLSQIKFRKTPEEVLSLYSNLEGIYVYMPYVTHNFAYMWKNLVAYAKDTGLKIGTNHEPDYSGDLAKECHGYIEWGVSITEHKKSVLGY